MCKQIQQLIALCAFSAGLAVLPAFQVKVLPIPEKPARKITMYYLELGMFIRYTVDSMSIKSRYSLETRVRQPDVFLHQLQAALAAQRALPIDSIGYRHVRVLYAITYADGRRRSLIVDVGNNVLWNGRMYAATLEIKRLLLAPIRGKARVKLEIDSLLVRSGRVHARQEAREKK